MHSIIGIVILGVILLSMVLLIAGSVVAIIVTRKEKKAHIRVTAEAKKIDTMAIAGRITAEEARELKQAFGPIAFTQTSRKPDVHIKVVGILNIVFGGLGVLIGGIFPLGLLEFFSQNAGDGARSTWAFLAFLPLLIIPAVFILRIVSAVRLMKGVPWARIVIIVFSVLGIIAFPIGTAVGIYALWVLLFREDAGLYFISGNND